MKGKQQDIYSIINLGKSAYKAVILYGPNTFVINDLYKKLSKTLIDEDKEIFGSREFDAKEIIGDADSFYNEAQSFGLGADKKYIRINIVEAVKENFNHMLWSVSYFSFSLSK